MGDKLDSKMNTEESNIITNNSCVYVITFYDYDHDIIKHIFSDKKVAESKLEQLQTNRTWGFYHLHKIFVE